MQVTKFDLVTDLKIMLSNVTHSHFNFECNKERGPIDQLYIELGPHPRFENLTTSLLYLHLLLFPRPAELGKRGCNSLPSFFVLNEPTFYYWWLFFKAPPPLLQIFWTFRHPWCWDLRMSASRYGPSRNDVGPFSRIYDPLPPLVGLGY